MKSIMITADDYGLSQQTNFEITRLALGKKVDNISLLVNTKNSFEAVNLYKKNRLGNLGLHFNLIEGRPLSDCKLIPSLVNREGEFYPLPIFIIRLFFKKLDLAEVETELKNQLAFFQKHGLKCHHLDSHQNTHFFSPIKKIVYKEAKKANIEFVRQSLVIENRLRKFPLKLFLYKIAVWLFDLKFRGVQLFQSAIYETSVCHPGTNYD